MLNKFLSKPDKEGKLIPSNELQIEYSKIFNKIQLNLHSTPKYIVGKVTPNKMHEDNQQTEVENSRLFQTDAEVEESYQQTDGISRQNFQSDIMVDNFLQKRNSKVNPFNNISAISFNTSVNDTQIGNPSQYLIGKEKHEAIRIQKVWRGYRARRKFKLLMFKKKQQKFQQKQKQEPITQPQPQANKLINLQKSQIDPKFLQNQKKEQPTTQPQRQPQPQPNKQKIQQQSPIRENEMINKFLMYCVLMIQKNVKGYIQRRSYRQQLYEIRNFQEQIQTLYLGWKVRKVFKLKKIIGLKHQVLELINMYEDLVKNKSNEDKQFLKQIQKTLKNKKQEFASCVQLQLKTTYVSIDNSLRTSPSKGNSRRVSVDQKPFKNQQQKQKIPPSGQQMNESRGQPIGDSRVQSAWDEVPVGSKLKNRMTEFTEQPTWDEVPVGSRSKPELTEQEQQEENEQVNQKREFLKKRTKYNPKQSILKSKQKPIEEQIENVPEVIVVQEKPILKRIPKQIKQKQEPIKQEPIKYEPIEIKAEKETWGEESTIPSSEVGQDRPKRNFQKKKSQKVKMEKLNWKNVESKVNIWKEEKNQIDYGNKNFVTNSNTHLGYGKNIIQADQFIEQGAMEISVAQKTLSPFKKTTPQKPAPRQPIASNYQVINKDHFESQNYQKISQQKYENHVPLEDLQKALSMNFGVKYAKIMNQIKPIQQQRSKAVKPNTSIPIISTNSLYVSKFSASNFENLVTEMEKKYEILQKLSD